MFLKLLKPLKNIKTSFTKGTFWFKMTLILLIILILVFLINLNKPIKEGFVFEKKYIEKQNDEIFDDFYVSIYDDLVYSKLKNDFEIGEIINKTSPTSSSKILDIGSGTGHHVKELKDKGFDVIGIDKSEAMVKFAKENYPDISIKAGDVMNNIEFQPSEFTHITCLYFTIYYIQNKSAFFSNCISWLKPGGYLILHLVDKETFDPIVPAANPFIVVSPQNYSKNRITTSNVVFNNFTYKSQFDPRGSNSTTGGIYPNDFIIYREIFKDNINGNVRENTHKLYMETQSNIINKAKNVGFIEFAKIDMSSCQYENQYLYILQKPT